MCLASSFAVICLESILDKNEKQKVINKLKESKKTIIEITFEQMNSFAGNMLKFKIQMEDISSIKKYIPTAEKLLTISVLGIFILWIVPMIGQLIF